MKALIQELRPALAATAVLAVITCAAYPFAVTAVSQVAFPAKAEGSLIRNAEGQVVGSALIGQNFTGERYFHPRPSAAGSGYDGSSSSGSNLGPTSQKLHDQIKERLAAYRSLNGLAENATVPADAVTASASGLDPHISPANARLQTARVAKARGLTPEQVQKHIADNTEPPAFGLLGEPGVNVLKLNLALDSAAAAVSN